MMISEMETDLICSIMPWIVVQKRCVVRCNSGNLGPGLNGVNSGARKR